MTKTEQKKVAERASEKAFLERELKPICQQISLLEIQLQNPQCEKSAHFQDIGKLSQNSGSV